MPREAFLFAGPTLGPNGRALARAAGVRRRPPAMRRDIETLVRSSRVPGVIVLADGVFHAALAVGHAEIREALDRGWHVWGVASMGAIRAREMQTLGMRGYGKVFARYAAEGDFQDDEVALVHEVEPPYRALSEPLVHLREALAHLAAVGIVPLAVARAVEDDLKRRWFGDRTLAGTIRALVERGADDTRVRAELVDFARFRTKTLDLEQLLRERPWIESPARAPNDVRKLDGPIESGTTRRVRSNDRAPLKGTHPMAAKKSNKVTISIDPSVLDDLLRAAEALDKIAIAAHISSADTKLQAKAAKHSAKKGGKK